LATHNVNVLLYPGHRSVGIATRNDVQCWWAYAGHLMYWSRPRWRHKRGNDGHPQSNLIRVMTVEYRMSLLNLRTKAWEWPPTAHCLCLRVCMFLTKKTTSVDSAEDPNYNLFMITTRRNYKKKTGLLYLSYKLERLVVSRTVRIVTIATAHFPPKIQCLSTCRLRLP